MYVCIEEILKSIAMKTGKCFPTLKLVLYSWMLWCSVEGHKFPYDGKKNIFMNSKLCIATAIHNLEFMKKKLHVSVELKGTRLPPSFSYN